MEKKSKIYPGVVFTAKNYDPFTKKLLIHPFVCVYNQALDPNLNGETNIIALLITSNNKQISRQIPILKSKNPFLDKDSYCYSNNIYMFLKEDVTVIGQLDSDTFFAIVQKRQLMLRGENDQCVLSLMNMRAYESKTAKDESFSQRNEDKSQSKKSNTSHFQKKVEQKHTDERTHKCPVQLPNKKKHNSKSYSSSNATKPIAHNVNSNNQKGEKSKANIPAKVAERHENTQGKNSIKSKKNKKIERGPVIIGEPHQQSFKANPQKKKKKKGFFKSKKKKDKRDCTNNFTDDCYIEN